MAAASVPHAGRRRHGDAAVLQAALAAVAGQGARAPASRTGCSGCGSWSGCATGPGRGRGSCCSARASARTPARTSSCTGARWASRRWASTGRCGSARRTAAGGCTRSPGRDRLDVDRDAVAVVNDFGQLERPRRGAPRQAALRAAQPRQRRRHQVRPRPAHRTAPAWLGPDRPSPEPVAGRQPPRHPAEHALAADHDVLPEPDRHEERPDPGRLPGLGPRLPPRPGPVRQRGLRPAGDPGAAGAVEAPLEARETYREKLFTPAPKDAAAPDGAAAGS